MNILDILQADDFQPIKQRRFTGWMAETLILSPIIVGLIVYVFALAFYDVCHSERVNDSSKTLSL
jgi:hypothetical protein